MNKRDKIIHTAIRLFVEQGFENTPTSQISKEADVATGTLFHHFKTKEELINAAYLYLKEKAVHEIALATTGNSKQQLKVAWSNSLRWGFENQDAIQFWSLYKYSKYITAETKQKGGKVLEPLTNVLKTVYDEGLCKDVPRGVIEQTYYSMYEAIFTFLTKKKKIDSALIESGFTMMWDALKR